MKNEDESVNIIRETKRNLLILTRKGHRDRERDANRPLQTQSNDPKYPLEIAKKLTTSASVTKDELSILKNFLAESAANVNLFLSVPRAMRGLVREISSVNVRGSMASACVCNVAAWLPDSSDILLGCAPIYISINLESKNVDFAVTSAWTLGNLAASGHNSCTLLLSQGVLSKLIHVFKNTCYEELKDAVLYAMLHFIYKLQDDLPQNYIDELFDVLETTEINSTTARCLFLLSCHDQFITVVKDSYISSLVDKFVIQTSNYSPALKDLYYSYIYLVRTLANVCCLSHYCHLTLSSLASVSYNSQFKLILNINGELRESLLWLLGNLYIFSIDTDLRDTFFEKLAT